MRISLQRTLQTLVCILAPLVLPPQSLAQDDTNASLIPGSVWGQMNQVMGGVSSVLPSRAAINGPAGIYANVLLSGAITMAQTAQQQAQKKGLTLSIDNALTNYFDLLLDNTAVSGLLLGAKWSDLNPYPPSGREEPRPFGPRPYAWNYLDDAFSAINAWNHANPSKTPKTLQLDVTPGFNSPAWLFSELSSCDGLFTIPAQPVSSSCGYTNIFLETESGTPTPLPLPLPWNPTYKSEWQAFLVALNEHIASKPQFVSSLVSIGVAGPTASSTEIILPNGRGTNNPGTLTLPAAYVPPGYSPAGVTALQAWISLVTNNYGATSSSYVNSDRAFIEEWNAAIDMFGQIFSGVTLTVDTGDGLPDFSIGEGSSALLAPPPAFTQDCGTNPTMATMDCAAETAILAYFAEPPVGGANAKATAEDGLVALGTGTTSGPLDAASVKWLSQSTSAAILTVLPGSPAVVSRMLGGLQLAKSFYKDPTTEGCPGTGACIVTCPTGTCNGTVTPPTPEQALLYVLTNYFAGTSVGAEYGVASGKTFTGSFTNAPINYLQIWDTDFLYAAGLMTQLVTGQPNCTDYDLMSNNPSNLTKCKVSMAAYTVTFNGKNMTAHQLLDLASQQILKSTAEAVTLPPVCCARPYVPRGAFGGDYVCVTPAESSQAAADNAAAQSNYLASANYTKIPSVPYGLCVSDNGWRHAYMGDYVCVTSTQEAQVTADNAAFPTRVQFCPRAPLPVLPGLPLPVLPGLPLPGFPLPGPPGPE